jgi:hypothetical protein
LITFSCFSHDLYHHSVMFSSVQEINVKEKKNEERNCRIELIVRSPSCRSNMGCFLGIRFNQVIYIEAFWGEIIGYVSIETLLIENFLVNFLNLGIYPLKTHFNFNLSIYPLKTHFTCYLPRASIILSKSVLNSLNNLRD